MNGRCVGSVTLKMRLYKLCRDLCFLSCLHPRCHAGATCVKQIMVSCLLMLCVFCPFLSWNLEFTHCLELNSSHTPHSVDNTATLRQKHILLLGDKRSGRGSVYYSLCCSTLKSISSSNVVQFFVEFQKTVFFPQLHMWKSGKLTFFF